MRRNRTAQRARVAAALGALVASALAFAPARASDCAQPVEVPGVGMACPVDGGFHLTLSDGLTLFTHGGDLHGAYGSERYTLPGQKKPACIANPKVEFHAQAIYAHAKDKPNRYAKKLLDVRGMIYTMNGILRSDAAEFKRVVNYRFTCSSGEVSVRSVTLPTRELATTYLTIVEDLRELGLASPLVKYVIYYDGHPPGTPAGIADLPRNDSLIADNPSNFGNGYAVNFGNGLYEDGARVMMHENGHNMGAVQNSAPHSSQGGHCYDGLDVMCYADDGSLGSFYSARACSGIHFDCRHDDYFHPNPPKSNYLYTHWNVGSPLNRFLSGCTYMTGIISAGAPVAPLPALPASPPAGALTRSHSIPTACRGHGYALSGVVAPPEAVASVYGQIPHGQTGNLPTATVGRLTTLDFSVCFYAGSSLLSCATASGTDRGTIPAKATRAVISMHAGGNGIYTLNVV